MSFPKKSVIELTPIQQLVIGVSIPICGLLLSWFVFASALPRSGAVLVAFAIFTAGASYSALTDHTEHMSTRLAVMREGYKQAFSQAAVVADIEQRDGNEERHLNARDSATEAHEKLKEIQLQIKDNNDLHSKVSNLHKRCLKVETWLAVAGTLIWGFGDLVTLGMQHIINTGSTTTFGY